MSALLLAIIVLVPAIAPPVAPPAPAVMADADAPLPPDAELPAWRAALLATGFRVASAIPRNPHANDRAQAEERVALAELVLGRPKAAERLAREIVGWRRGMALAEIGATRAREGHVDESRRLLREAARVGDGETEWRRDRVRVAVAKGYAWLGDAEEAKRLAAGAAPEEAGRLAETNAAKAAEAAAALAELDGLAGSGQFDLVRHAVDGYLRLLERSWGDEAVRSSLETRIRGAFKGMPSILPIDAFARMAEVALRRDDPARALAYLAEARTLVEESGWMVEDRVATEARLAALRFRSGQREEARAEAETAEKLFAEGRERILDIDRAAPLRALGEAWAAMEEGERARAAYRRALQEGAANPNARPRAVDLAATCVSMARAGVEPDEPFTARVEEIRQALGDPW